MPERRYSRIVFHVLWHHIDPRCLRALVGMADFEPATPELHFTRWSTELQHRVAVPRVPRISAASGPQDYPVIAFD